MSDERNPRQRVDETDTPFDDLELERTAVADEAPTAVDAAGGPRDGFLPYALAAAALLAAGLLATVYFVFRTPAAPRPAAAAPSAAPSVSATAAPTPAPPLPRLDDSDALARSLGAALSNHPELARWLARAGLVRVLAAVVTNVADGESPRPHLEFLAPAQRFRARAAGRGALVADAAGFAGYDAFGDVLASVDARSAAAAYRTLEPLFDEAHRELGHPEGRFRASLDKAVATLLATPVPAADAPLEPHATLLRWADPALESLTPAQKQFLRIGPRNVRILQGKLRELQSALAAPPAP